MNEYYTESKIENHKWLIKWNAEKISGSNASNANPINGYILQHMMMHNPDSCQDYYEAWKVEDGVVEAQYDGDEKLEYDDQWIPDLVKEDDGIQSLKKKAVFDSKVYWIPTGTVAYEEIHGWTSFKGGRSDDYLNGEKIGVPYAGRPKSSWTIDTDISEYFVFDRHKEWEAGLKL